MTYVPIAIATLQTELLNQFEPFPSVAKIRTERELEAFMGRDDCRCLLLDSGFPNFDLVETISTGRENNAETVVLLADSNTQLAIQSFRAGAIEVIDMLSENEGNWEAHLATLSERCTRSAQDRQQWLKLNNLIKLARHDIKGPLRTIIGFSKLLEQNLAERIGEEDREYLGFIRKSAEKGFRLLDKLKEFTDASNAIVLSEITLDSSLLGLNANSRAKLESGNVNLNWTEAPQVLGDVATLAQLFSELIDNGLKYNANEQGAVEISAERDGSYWKFEVRDNGIGIDPSRCEQIFDPLCRLHPESEFVGSGLGLTISRIIVRAHGGEISVASKLDRGSSVFFNLRAAG